MTLRRIVLAGLVFLAGCAAQSRLPFGFDEESYKRVYAPFRDACRIEYIEDKVEYAQTPEETKARGKGDCEDFAVYLKDLWEKEGIGGRLVFGYLYQTDAVMTNGEIHAWNEIKWHNRTFIADASAPRFAEKKKVPKNMYVEISDILDLNVLRKAVDKRANYGNIPSGILR